MVFISLQKVAMLKSISHFLISKFIAVASICKRLTVVGDTTEYRQDF